MSETLDRLCALNGIQPFYSDVWKRRHAVPEHTKHALLAAMGFPSEAEALEESLEDSERQRWERVLPPVLVADEGAVVAVTVTLPAGVHDLQWRIVTEDGDRHAGACRSDELEMIETTVGTSPAYERRCLVPRADLPTGYHRLELQFDASVHTMRLIVAPERCWTVEDAAGSPRVWGLAAQIYSLRSPHNWGMGDFTDLAHTAEAAAGLGADLLGINPVHALFYADPHHLAPYSPSNRAFLNFLYIDIATLPELRHCPEVERAIAKPEFQQPLRAARNSELVDYVAVSAVKRPLLEALFQSLLAGGATGGPMDEEWRAFEAFRTEIGPALERHSIFEALHERFFSGGAGEWSWQQWPEPYRDCTSAAVQAFADENRDRVAFFAWLQWCADRQLAEAQRRACAAGMRIGLYRDLAVAAHGGGSAAWMHPATLLYGASVGAPPDELAPDGQNWGITPLAPEALREAAYEPFVTVLRANMRHAGALRIDHAMVLERLFCIPTGMSGADGAYIRYPFADLLRIIALESQRARCVIIAEDLGTVPEGFRPALERAGVLSYRILMFERDESGAFNGIDAYPPQALAASSTHDLPTLTGFWTGRDLEWRERLSTTMTDGDKADARRRRRDDRAHLLSALQQTGSDIAQTPGMADLREAVYRFLAQTPSSLVMVPIEDLTGEIEQPNLPGTTNEHPNWRRKLSRLTAEVLSDPAVRRLAAELSALRPVTGRATQ